MIAHGCDAIPDAATVATVTQSTSRFAADIHRYRDG